MSHGGVRTASRRRALQALAALPFGPPLARALRADPGAPPPKRLVLLMQNNGTQQANFWPDATLSSPILDALFLDPATGRDNGLRAKTNIVKGVHVPFDAAGTNANQHDMGFARMFTGHRLVSRAGGPWGGGPSVDQIVARRWGVDTLTLAVLASETEPHPKPGFDHRESFSYLGPATLKHPRRNPLRVFDDLFGPPTAASESAARIAHRRSVLDAVNGNLIEISARLGPAERSKLDLHVTAIHDVEKRMTAPPVACDHDLAPPPDYLVMDPRAEVSADTFIPRMVDNMIDIMTLAFRCGVFRIATLQFGYGGGKWRFGWKGINMNCHDDVAHKDVGDAGGDPATIARVVLMNQYYAACVARLATALDAIPEGGGTLLDSTLIVWANEQGRGDHSLSNVPIVLIGGAGGAIPRAGRLIDRGPQVFNRVGCTVLRAMGLEAAGFGDVPSCGVIEGLI
jgi:Protein of unknown function (DUF1552)